MCNNKSKRFRSKISTSREHQTPFRCSPESRRSNGESPVVQGSEEQVGTDRSTANTKAPQNNTGLRAT